MGKEFEIRKEVELEASPEQVWDAIATGPGLSSWLFPHDVEPGEGGIFRLNVSGYTEESTITGWDPPRRLAVQGAEGEDGTLMAFEYLIEGRDGNTSILRFVHTGHLGEGWGDEYETMTGPGWDHYLHTLGQYLKHFPGATATYILAQGPKGRPNPWPVLATALGLPGQLAQGDQVRLAPAGLPPIDGVVDYLIPATEHGFFLGIRTADALYRFHGKPDGVDVGHHLFADTDQKESEAAWHAFLTRTFS